MDIYTPSVKRPEDKSDRLDEGTNVCPDLRGNSAWYAADSEAAPLPGSPASSSSLMNDVAFLRALVVIVMLVSVGTAVYVILKQVL